MPLTMTHKEWMDLTHSMTKPRSAALKKIDAAVQSRNQNAALLALKEWIAEQEKKHENWQQSVRNKKGGVETLAKQLNYGMTSTANSVKQKFTVVDFNLTKDLEDGLAGVKLTGFTIPKGLRMIIEIDLIKEDFDPMVAQFMSDGAAKQYHSSVDTMVAFFSEKQQLLSDTLKRSAQFDPTAFISRFESDFNKMMTDERRKIKDAALAGGKHLLKVHAQARAYEIGIAIRVGTASASLVAATAIMASAPFTMGLSAVVGIYGMTKTIITLGKEAYQGWKDVEAVLKVIRADLEKLRMQTKRGAVASSVANALTSQFINADFLPTVGKMNTNFKLAEDKTSRVIKGCHGMTKEIQKILVLDKSSLPAEKLNAVEKNLHSLLEKNHSLMAGTEVTNAEIEKIKTDLAKFSVNIDTETLDKVLGYTLKAIDTITGPIQGGIGSMEEIIRDSVLAAGFLAMELGGEKVEEKLGQMA